MKPVSPSTTVSFSDSRLTIGRWSTHRPKIEDQHGAPEDMLRLYDSESIRVRGNCENISSHRRVNRRHTAICTNLDQAFGQLVKVLAAKGLADNSIVVFTSDHDDTLLSYGFTHNQM